MDDEIEAKQNYIDFIFHPGRFPVAVINKALSVSICFIVLYLFYLLFELYKISV